jgi:NADH-quinone oxidoreductase subunit N
VNFPDLQLFAFGPELALAAGALVALLFAAFGEERRGPLAAAGVLASVVALVWWAQIGPADWSFGGDYGGDGISYFARGFFVLVALAMTVLLCGGEAAQRPARGEFLALLYISVVGMMVMASAHNWVVVFLGLETMSIPLYVMAAYYRTDSASIEAGVKYFVYGAFASAFFVYGLALVYAATGTLDQIMLFEAGPLTRVLAAGLMLLLVGLAFKVAAVPFHMWAPDAYTGAPTPVTAFFAVAPKAAAFVALYRLTLLGAELAGPALLTVLAALAVLTIVLGNLWALVQVRLKRMLAYSSIAHAGYLLLALVAFDSGGDLALQFYLVAYGLMTLGAFVVLLLFEKDGPADTYDDLSGGASRRPFAALAMTIFMISLAGFPATAGFIGKLQIFRALLEKGDLALVLVAIAGSLVSVAYYLRVIVYLYMRPAPAITSGSGTRTWTWLAAALAAGVLLFGLFPDLVWSYLMSWSHGPSAVQALSVLP